MPTGYTCGVQEGKITTLEEFALRCARAMGANIMMRDERMDAPIKEYEVSPWHAEQLEAAKAWLYDFERMSLEEAAARIDKENAERSRELWSAKEKAQIERNRYETMLANVKAWTPPTADHEGLKKFMIEQLEDSIKHDCYERGQYYQPDIRTPQEYLREQIAEAKRQVADREETLAKEHKVTRERNEWNRQLRESLAP